VYKNKAWHKEVLVVDYEEYESQDSAVFRAFCRSLAYLTIRLKDGKIDDEEFCLAMRMILGREVFEEIEAYQQKLAQARKKN
jgi:hypothetical protein